MFKVYYGWMNDALLYNLLGLLVTTIDTKSCFSSLVSINCLYASIAVYFRLHIPLFFGSKCYLHHQQDHLGHICVEKLWKNIVDEFKTFWYLHVSLHSSLSPLPPK